MFARIYVLLFIKKVQEIYSNRGDLCFFSLEDDSISY